jgi:hypothetical protein
MNEKKSGKRGYFLLENTRVKKGEFRSKIISEREGRKLHNSELHNLYSSSNVIRMIKLWRVRRT